MSRIAMAVGLIASICLHVVLLGHAAIEKGAIQSNTTEIPIVPVMLQDQFVQESLPEPQPQPKAEPEPTPQPKLAKPAPPVAQPSVPLAQARQSPSLPSPAPPLTTTAAAQSATIKTKGDYAGQTDGQHQPALRINWGNAQHAQKVLEQGQMKLVIIDTAQGKANVTKQLVFKDHRWHRTEFEANVRIRFSNQLRIVDDVPAFRTAASAAALDRTKHLAILVPDAVEQTLHSAQLAAAFERGLSMRQIRNFGGQFQLGSRQLNFEITQIQARSPRP